MNTIGTPVKRIATQTLLSTLWIVVVINMLKADILSLYIPGAAEELARTAGDIPISRLMLGGAIMTVSYTHLDVYKRQETLSLFAGRLGRLPA